MAGYIPTSGYFNLTEKPKGMTAKEHKKIQGLQTVLVREAERYKDPKVKRLNWAAYEKLKQYMAELQYIILQRWPHDMLFK